MNEPSSIQQNICRLASYPILAAVILAEAYYTYRVRLSWPVLEMVLTGVLDLSVVCFYFWRARNTRNPLILTLIGMILALAHLTVVACNAENQYSGFGRDPVALSALGEAVMYLILWYILRGLVAGARLVRSFAGARSVDTSASRWKYLRPLALALTLLALCSYPPLKLRWAKKQVETLCSEVVVGAPAPMLEERARKLGLRTRQRLPFNKPGESTRKQRFMAWEGFVFSRWFCDVEISDGLVHTKRVSFLD